MKARRLTRQMREALASGEAEAILAAAARVLEARAKYGLALSTPNAVREYLRVTIGALEHEVFACVWLDAQNRVIEFEVLFRGTLTQTSVYPREVVKSALRHNAAGVVVSHSHPSGIAQPSQADELLTRQLRDVLMLVDVKVLDHLIVAGTHSWSFAEHGLL